MVMIKALKKGPFWGLNGLIPGLMSGSLLNS